LVARYAQIISAACRVTGIGYGRLERTEKPGGDALTKLNFRAGTNRWLAVITAATGLAVTGLWLGRIASYSPSQSNILTFLELCLLMPGYVVAALIAAAFLPGGGHSVGQLFWLAAPVSWIFYLVMGVVVFCVRWDD
jgi:Na+/alanine symporter